MTRWWWVRHGPTHEKTFVGWRDVPADLSDAAKMARVSAALPKTALIVSSDLIRCVATASALQKRRQPLPQEAHLREFNFGAWDGLSFDEVNARDPILCRDFWEKPGDLKAPDGESWNDVADRVSGVVTRLSAEHGDVDIIAVAHFGVILSQMGRTSGHDPHSALAQKIEPLSISRIDWSPDRAELIFVNQQP